MRIPSMHANDPFHLMSFNVLQVIVLSLHVTLYRSFNNSDTIA